MAGEQIIKMFMMNMIVKLKVTLMMMTKHEGEAQAFLFHLSRELDDT